MIEDAIGWILNADAASVTDLRNDIPALAGADVAAVVAHMKTKKCDLVLYEAVAEAIGLVHCPIHEGIHASIQPPMTMTALPSLLSTGCRSIHASIRCMPFSPLFAGDDATRSRHHVLHASCSVWPGTCAFNGLGCVPATGRWTC